MDAIEHACRGTGAGFPSNASPAGRPRGTLVWNFARAWDSVRDSRWMGGYHQVSTGTRSDSRTRKPGRNPLATAR